MPKVLVVAMVVGLSLGLGLVARSGFGAWLDWVNEPLRQPPDLHLVRPPVTGAPAAPRQAQPTTLPPTLAPPSAPTTVPTTAVRPTSTPPGQATAARPTSAPPAALASTPQRTATPAVGPTVGTPRPNATAVPLTGQERRVANTDGQGVALRDAPGGARQPARGYDEGEVVTILEQQGTWTHIRGHDGREGWVLSVTLGQ